MTDQADRSPKPPLWLLVALASTGTLAMHMFVPALPYAADDLGVGSAAVQLSLTLYVLGLAAGQLAYGPVSDALGRRPVVIAALSIFVLGSLGCAVAQSLPLLLAGRLTQAMGGAGGLALARAIARDAAGPEGSQRDISLLNAVMLIGPAISPVLGGGIAALADWRWIFLVLGLLALGTLAATLVRLPETARHRKPLRLGQMKRDFAVLGRNRRFVCIALGGAMGSTTTYGYFAAAPFILHEQLGVPGGEVGFYVGGILLGALAGTWVSRLRIRVMSQDAFLMLAGLLAIAAAALFLAAAWVGMMTPALIFALTLALMFAAGCISPTALSAALDAVPALAGSAAGLFGAGQMACGALSTFLVGLGTRHDLSCGIVLLGATLVSYALLRLGRSGG
ncbi:MAG: multidrug effflux MFS transporter [Rhodobacteraceae bacterium]|nr:multidrug effflux MFS transporter [Paracoccaceae bacterium]